MGITKIIIYVKLSLISILIFSFFTLSCNSSQKTVQKKQDVLSYKKIAQKKYEGQIKYQFNSDSSYVLCQNQHKSGVENPYPNLKYFIYDVKNDHLIFEDSLPNGSVKWRNNSQVEASLTPEIVKGDEHNSGNYGYIFDVKGDRKILKEGEDIQPLDE